MVKDKVVLIVDNEINSSNIAKDTLERSGYKVVCTQSGKQAMELFNELEPDLFILDLILPDIPGEEICIEIRKKSNLPIMILSSKNEESDIINGLNIGADDYITKPFSPKQLLARVSAVLRRIPAENTILSNKFTFYDGELTIDELRHEVRKFGEHISLTPKEFKILLTLAKHPQKAFSREELIAIIIGEKYCGLNRVIDTHIKKIRQKLGDNWKSPHYILTVQGTGYMFGVMINN